MAPDAISASLQGMSKTLRNEPPAAVAILVAPGA
jgi:hypothetical protein